jgi:putative PEP-CTERM system integral membrane protein
MEQTSPEQTQSYSRLEMVQYALFWSWNLIFLAFMSFGFAPIVLPETFIGVRTGVIPATFLLFGLILAGIPVAAVVLGLTVLRRAPSKLFALGYVIEGPLMLMLAVRFFAIRQATTGVTLLVVIVLLGMAGFLWYLLDSQAGKRAPSAEWLRLAGLTLMALVSLYAAAWIAFYALPIAVEVLRAIGNFLANLPDALSDIGRSLRQMMTDSPLLLPFSILGFILLLYTATLFVLTPIAVPYLSLRAWWRMAQHRAGVSGWLQPAVLTCLVVAVTAGLFVLSNRQPQAQAFALLKTPPASIGEAQALLTNADSIRAGLLNAYLAPFRYISAEGEVRHISDMYASTFEISRIQANAVQRLYEGLASPLLYQPIHRPQLASFADNQALLKEPREAAALYQNFFDTPIIEAERQTIVNSVRTTWSSDQAEAAWQAVDDREVFLVHQELTLQEHGDWADVELHEVYQNQTADEQEVIYYFSLPESAVMTGLWLGSTPDKSAASTFQVAPRGAAQAVYREQTRVMKDPALLEQIGPRQYRLRVFPIPPLQVTYDERRARSLVEEAPPVSMWVSWREMADRDAWPMPHMAFLRNVYWNDDTVRLVNGQPMAVDPDEWLSESIPAAAPVTAQSHRVDLPGGQTVLAEPADPAETPALPDGMQLAVVIDRSYSMQIHAGAVTDSIQELKNLPNLSSPTDVYQTSSPYRGEDPSMVSLDALNPDDLVYFGGQNAAQLLDQFDTLHTDERSDRQYDAVIVLTDGSGYELGPSDVPAPGTDSPIWLVHAGSDIPLGYDDQTLQAIQASGGGVAGSLGEALERIASGLNARPGSDAAITDQVDGYVWSVLPTEQAAALSNNDPAYQVHTAGDPFSALAARRLALAETMRQRGSISELATLDMLHTLAKRYQIVTPYSSMIVLVDDQQQRLLEHLSEGSDRYQREVESLGDTTPGSPLPLAGVPEPHEWLLLALAATLLVYMAYTRRGKIWQV